MNSSLQPTQSEDFACAAPVTPVAGPTHFATVEYADFADRFPGLIAFRNQRAPSRAFPASFGVALHAQLDFVEDYPYDCQKPFSLVVDSFENLHRSCESRRSLHQSSPQNHLRRKN